MIQIRFSALQDVRSVLATEYDEPLYDPDQERLSCPDADLVASLADTLLACHAVFLPRSLKRKDCVTSQKRVCDEGYGDVHKVALCEQYEQARP